MSEADGICISRLIALVRERPVLWDRQEEVYKNRKLTKKAWAEICESLLENYNELADEEQKAFGRSVIGKWANLRDNWLRYWRKRQDHVRSGLSNNRFKKYIHHDQLMFLSKVYDQSETDMQQDVEEIQVEVDVLSDPGSESPLGFSSEEVSQTPWSHGLSAEEGSQTPWSMPLEIENPEDESLPPLPPLTEERHLYFYQSTLPLIADFDENQVLEFHGAVLECIKRIKTGKNTMNIMPAPQPAYILAIAQPQGFLANTELKTKPLITPNTVKQCSESPELMAQNKDSDSISSQNISSTSIQITTSPKHINEEESKIKPASNPPANKPTTSELELTDLRSVVNKLDEISKTFEIYPFEDSYDKFGKYIGSFLRTLPRKKAQLLKKRIVRQVLRLQLTEKINTNHFHKPLERLNQNNAFLPHSCISSKRTHEVDVRTNTLTPEEKDVASTLGLKNTKISKSCNDESTRTITTNNTKPSGDPCSLFPCHICASVCVSSDDLRSHCLMQHEGYSSSCKNKTSPVRRGRRGRKKRNYNSIEFTV